MALPNVLTICSGMSRTSQLVIGSCLLLFALAIYLLPGVLFSLGEPSRDVVSRVPAPNRAVDALVIETNGGATTSFG